MSVVSLSERAAFALAGHDLADDAMTVEAEDIEMMDAMAWAAGSEGKDERLSDSVLLSLANRMTEELRQSWLVRWRDHRAGPRTSGGQSITAPARRNRTYGYRKTCKLASRYVALQQTYSGKHAQPGVIAKFLTSNGMSADRCSRLHFDRVVKKCGSRKVRRPASPWGHVQIEPSKAPVAGPLANRVHTK